MKPIVQRWTDEENERLRRFAAEGASAARVAAALNRKINSVTLQASKLGFRFPTVREQRRKIVPAPTSLWRPY
jgi:hypothetical protein